MAINSLPLGEPVSDASAKLPFRTKLEGRTVTLRPLLSSDAETLFPLLCNPENDALWTYLFAGPFRERADFDRYISGLAQSTDPCALAICDKVRNQISGFATYLRIEPKHRVIEVGHILFSPVLQKTVAATEAMYLMARHAFEDLGYRRYEWKCNALHAGSRRAALRYGFTFEGVFRKHMIIKGRNRDTAWFSIVDSDWPPIKAAFERWLEPANFDANGGQRQSLAAIREHLTTIT